MVAKEAEKKETRESRQVRYYREHLDRLVDGKIISVGAIKDDSCYGSERWQVLEIVKPDGTVYQINASRDPEGNGPGHLFIDEVEDGLRELTRAGECDWGHCKAEAVKERASPDHGWLQVCKKHLKGPPVSRVRQKFSEVHEAAKVKGKKR